ncbi:FxSxx-COOH cyclophane-containing RiPP peptide [Streptomyces lateritius]|uniref:FxSxx-COOH cyclophane-containing RiPP peptide n=1 Tax=Streptomyces lateritius TaxID=67313 RepID=A0ABW6YBN2_9ACTN
MAVAEGAAPVPPGPDANSAVPESAVRESGVPDSAVLESVVLDIAGLALDEVAALPDSVLGAVLRRVYDSCAAGDPFVTGHTESA